MVLNNLRKLSAHQVPAVFPTALPPSYLVQLNLPGGGYPLNPLRMVVVQCLRNKPLVVHIVSIQRYAMDLVKMMGHILIWDWVKWPLWVRHQHLCLVVSTLQPSLNKVLPNKNKSLVKHCIPRSMNKNRNLPEKS